MKTTFFFNKAVWVCVLTLLVSCTKDDSAMVIGNDVIILTVPPMPGFGNDIQSRTIFDDNGTKPTVRWKIDDSIYVGSIDETVANKTTLKVLTEQGRFTVFKCIDVADDGTATFAGTSIPEGANLALYTKHPEKVEKVFANNYLALDSPCTMEPPQNSSLGHLGENDLLVATFDCETKSFKLGTGSCASKAFGRVFGIGKFILSLPENAVGNIGKFKSLTTGTGKLSSKGRAQVYKLHDKTGLPSLWGISGEFIIDCSNLKEENNQVVFYSLIGTGNINAKTLNFSLEVGDKIYYATTTAKANVSQSSAIQFKLDFSEPQ